MSRLRVLALYALPALLLIPLAAACGGDDDDDGDDGALPSLPPASVTPSPSPTGEPTITPTMEASTPDPAVAIELASSPAYVLYQASAGQTLEEVARTLGTSDGAGLAQLNELTEETLVEGQLVAVPFEPDEGLLLPASALAAALGIEGDSGLQLMVPSTVLVDAYLGRVGLARVRTVGPEAVDGAGYILEYYFTDRPPMKGGEPDTEARFTAPAFTIGAGSLAPDLLNVNGEAYGAYKREAGAYSIVTFADAQFTPDQVWEQLEPANP